MTIRFSGPLSHGRDQLHTAVLLPLRRPALPPWINLGIYSIQDGRDLGLPQTIWDVHIINCNMMLLIETKIPD